MKHKKLLLISFLITLFAFQQVQSGITMPFERSPLSLNLQQGYNQPEISVKYWHLDPNSGARIEPPIACLDFTPTDFAYGCTQTTEKFYPYPANPWNVSLENDYLLNTVAKEMPAIAGNTGEDYPNLPALSAQAVAARSFAYYFHSQNFLMWNTSFASEGAGNMQVTVPYAFEYALGNSVLNDETQRCNRAVNILNEFQWLTCQAVGDTEGYYIALHGDTQPAKTDFGSDMQGVTNNGDKPHLVGVQDPISTACGANNNSAYGFGMSQKGANRWALGDQCANKLNRDQYNNGEKLVWPVTWTDYRQILAHYYTGIDILNGSGGKVAPDDRWNLLNYNLPNTTAIAGTNFTVNVTLQNTSTTDWTTDRFYLSFYTRRRISPLGAG